MTSYRFSEIRLPRRDTKPRQAGWTMVLDKFMGPTQIRDLLATAGDYADLLKFGWGTARITPEPILKEKIRLLRDREVGVCPGGTLMELAYLQNVVDPVLDEATRLGFDWVEVSDGTVEMAHQTKLEMISRARARGFSVISEVGKKCPAADRRMNLEDRITRIARELDAGAHKVIVEACESGVVGVFDESGQVISGHAEQLVARIGLADLVFEAPLAQQQIWFLSQFGNTVNIGNVAPHELLNLETLRRGLRGCTLRRFHERADSTA